MREFYEPVLNLSDPEHHNTMGAFLTLKNPVDGEILRSAVDALRTRFPYYYVRVASGGRDEGTVPNDLPMTVRNTWEPVTFNTEAANFHLAAWKYKDRRLAFEISHALTDATGVLPYVRSVLCLYLSKATGTFFDPSGFRLPGQPIPESETGNPFKYLDVDGAAPLYRKKPVPDFFRISCGADRDKTVFCLKLHESQVMQYCREFDGTPNVIVSVLMAKAARRLDPSCEKPVTAMVCIDHKALLGNHDNYRCFVGSAFLDFPRNRDLDNTQKACTISRGKLPPRQTLEGFFAGESVPVNPALSRIFIQLHITEHTGRGVPKIIRAYSQDNIRFNANSITVTIPYDRLGGNTPVTPQVTPQVASQADTRETERRILDYCSQARSTQEILAYLGLKDRKNLMAHIRALLKQGRIAQTIPDKPTSSKQKYITIK